MSILNAERAEIKKQQKSISISRVLKGKKRLAVEKSRFLNSRTSISIIDRLDYYKNGRKRRKKRKDDADFWTAADVRSSSEVAGV